MRRSDREVTDKKQILAIMEKCEFVYIAMNDPQESVPYLVPLSFGLEIVNDEILLYFHSAAERKKVSLLSDRCDVRFFMHQGHGLCYDEKKQSCTMNYESVSGSGAVEKLDDEEKLHGLDCLMRHYYPHQTPPYQHSVAAITNVYRLHVRSLTAKKREKRL